MRIQSMLAGSMFFGGTSRFVFRGGGFRVQKLGLNRRPTTNVQCWMTGLWGYIDDFRALYANVRDTLLPGGLLIFSVKSNDWRRDTRKVRSALEDVGCMEEVLPLCNSSSAAASADSCLQSSPK